MTTGDTGDGGASSQNMNSLNGKVLRINLDGSVPSDNPIPDSYVYSSGTETHKDFVRDLAESSIVRSMAKAQMMN